MGREPADTLMALLPPVGWADVATKYDLAQTERRLDERIDSLGEVLEHKLAATFERGLKDLSTKFFLGLLASNASFAAIAFGAARLLGS